MAQVVVAEVVAADLYRRPFGFELAADRLEISDQLSFFASTLIKARPEGWLATTAASIRSNNRRPSLIDASVPT